MMDSPFLRQMFVASSPQLAAISAGGVVGFPNVILEQFKANDSTIQLDLHLTTWIGATHGLAGLLGIFMPLIMQWRGRKFTYLMSCVIIITGWILIYLAKNITTIIIGECFHGLGLNSIVAISFSSLSEMIEPRYRIISMTFYIINETLGISVAGIAGRYLHWRTLSILMSIPVAIAFIIGCLWPESPAWLAYKGEYIKCEQAFQWLRGSNENSKQELKELLNAQKENFVYNKKIKFKDFWLKITRRDFYYPCFCIFVTLGPFYFGGMLVIVIYGVEMMQKASNSLSAGRYGMIASHAFLFLGSVITALLLKFFRNKTVFITSGISSAIFMFGASIASLMQSIGVLPVNSTLVIYFIALFMLFVSLGISTLPFSISGELMPVKHRDIGETVYVVLVSGLNTLVLKTCPYLILYIGLWALFLLFAVMNLVFIFFFWRYVPETKGKTLQQIEDYYNFRRFVTRNHEETQYIGVAKSSTID